MKKEERIERYGEAAWEKHLQQGRDWKAQWRKANPDKVKTNNQEIHRKGGKYYEKKRIYDTTGLQGERHRIRVKHGSQYRLFKQIIAPDSEIQHEWLPGTANYRGVALVEEDPHRHGIIKVIKILEGEITLFTEKEIAKGGM